MSASRLTPARASSAAAAARRPPTLPPCARRSTPTPRRGGQTARRSSPASARWSRRRSTRVARNARATGGAGAGRGGRRGRRGREARRAARLQTRAASVAYITRQLPLTEVLSEEGLTIIEHNAETILQEVGIDFKEHPRATALLKQAGCDVDGWRARFPRGLARQLVMTSPREFTQYARNPARSVPVGGKTTVFAPVYGSPFVHDLDRGRRYGTIEDFSN